MEEMEGTMRYKLICASCMMAVAVIGAAPAYAAPASPAECGSNGSGAPENPPPPANTYPGNSATSPGSVFNEPGLSSASGGKGNQAYNAAGADAQYDRACGRVTANGTGTLYQPNPDATITNNSRDTRATSHIGKGQTK
jgi:hypothetical protein